MRRSDIAFCMMAGSIAFRLYRGFWNVMIRDAHHDESSASKSDSRSDMGSLNFTHISTLRLTKPFECLSAKMEITSTKTGSSISVKPRLPSGQTVPVFE